MKTTITMHIYFLWRKDDWDAMLNSICEQGTSCKKSTQGALTINKSSFKPEARVWYHFLTTRLLPSTHGQTVSSDRVTLVDYFV